MSRNLIESATNLSEASSDKEDYEDETFEENTQNEDSFQEMSLSTLERLRDAHRVKTVPNKTFTPARIREIDRQNAILMNKILSYSRKPNKPKINPLPNNYQVTSAAINRKKNQRKIEWENQILLRKIQSVKSCIKF